MWYSMTITYARVIHLVAFVRRDITQRQYIMPEFSTPDRPSSVKHPSFYKALYVTIVLILGIKIIYAFLLLISDL